MSRYLSAALAQEASGWIAAQLLEEGAMLPDALVGAILDHEWQAIDAGADADDRPALIAAVGERLAADDVRVAPSPPPGAGAHLATPEPVPAVLIERVLSWEDDFLGLAGIRRGAG